MDGPHRDEGQQHLAFLTYFHCYRSCWLDVAFFLLRYCYFFVIYDYIFALLATTTAAAKVVVRLILRTAVW